MTRSGLPATDQSFLAFPSYNNVSFCAVLIVACITEQVLTERAFTESSHYGNKPKNTPTLAISPLPLILARLEASPKLTFRSSVHVPIETPWYPIVARSMVTYFGNAYSNCSCGIYRKKCEVSVCVV